MHGGYWPQTLQLSFTALHQPCADESLVSRFTQQKLVALSHVEGRESWEFCVFHVLYFSFGSHVDWGRRQKPNPKHITNTKDTRSVLACMQWEEWLSFCWDSYQRIFLVIWELKPRTRNLPILIATQFQWKKTPSSSIIYLFIYNFVQPFYLLITHHHHDIKYIFSRIH
jgi:hypothetical protein